MKKIDLFHLIENLNTFQYSYEPGNKKINSNFINFINSIRSIYYNNNMKDLSGKRHKFTCSYNLDSLNDFLIPENFITRIDSIN